MDIYKTVFDNELQGKNYLIAQGVWEEVTELTPPVYFDGWAYDIMSSDILDFGTYEVYPADKAAHSFLGWARDAEVPQ